MQRTALWEIKIPRSIQEVVRGGTGCISMRGEAGERVPVKQFFLRFAERPPSLVHIHHRSALQRGVWLHRLRFVIHNKEKTLSTSCDIYYRGDAVSGEFMSNDRNDRLVRAKQEYDGVIEQS